MSESQHVFAACSSCAILITFYWQLKRKYRTIDRFKNGTGRGRWSVTHGADISDLPEERQLWDDFMRTSDDVCKLIYPTQAVHADLNFRLKRWHLIATQDGRSLWEWKNYYRSHLPPRDMSVEGPPEPELELDYTAQDNESEQYFSTSTTDLSSFSDPADAASSQSMLGSTLLPDYNLDLDCLFDIGRDLTSPDPITQCCSKVTCFPPQKAQIVPSVERSSVVYHT
jgi:hypothetical protein